MEDNGEEGEEEEVEEGRMDSFMGDDVDPTGKIIIIIK